MPRTNHRHEEGVYMRKYLIGAIALVVLALGSVALAAPGSGNRLYCFSGTEDGGYNGTCTLTAGTAPCSTTTDGDNESEQQLLGRLRRQQQARGSADRRRRQAGLQLHREPGRRRLAAAQHPDRPERRRDDRGVRVRRRGRLQRRCRAPSIDRQRELPRQLRRHHVLELGGVRRGAADVPDRLRRAHVHHRRPARRLRRSRRSSCGRSPASKRQQVHGRGSAQRRGLGRTFPEGVAACELLGRG